MQMPCRFLPAWMMLLLQILVQSAFGFNNDGKTDILWRNHATGADMVYLMGGGNGAAVLSSPSITSVFDTNWNMGLCT